MNIEKKRIIINIILKIFFISVIIILNYIFIKYKAVNIFGYTSTVTEEANGSTTIYISQKYYLINVLIHSLSLFFIVDTITLLIYDIINLKNDKKYSIKYKLRIIFIIGVFIIISTTIEMIFMLLGPTVSIVLNIILLSTFLVKLYFLIKKMNN
jgi:hypothetical protein